MDAKWIGGLTVDTPVVEAAEKVLTARLDAVRYWLPLVAHAEKDIEFVHQLRVTTRRAGAALGLFRGTLEKKAYREVKRLLRELRQTAGAARDWDVFQETLFDELELPETLRDFLFGFATAQRMNAQVHLSRIAFDQRQPLDALRDQLPKWLAEAPSSPATDYGELCLRTVRSLLSELHRATHPIPADYHALHQVRILGKRLRYVLELSLDCFTSSAKETLLPAIEEAQKILGEANDAHVLQTRLEEIGYFVKKFRPREYPLISSEMGNLRRSQEQVLTGCRDRFTAWLQRWDAAGPTVTLRHSKVLPRLS